MSGWHYTQVALPLGKEPLIPIEWEAGWASEAVQAFWRNESLFSFPGFKPQLVQAVALSLYSLH